MLCFMGILMGPSAGDALAAPSVTIMPAADGVYTIQGSDCTDASGMDITVHYDPIALKNPNVEQGGLISGSLMAVNTLSPGMIRMALVRVAPINGSGIIATITFTRTGSSDSGILSLASSVTTSTGHTIAVVSQVVNSATVKNNNAATHKPANQLVSAPPVTYGQGKVSATQRLQPSPKGL